MRVLHVSSGLDPKTGGTATAAVSVALAARRIGLDVTLVAPVAPDHAQAIQPARQALAAAGVEVLTFPFAREEGPAVRWGIAPQMNRWLRAMAGSFDLVHTHSVWVWTSIAAIRAAHAAGKPAVLMPHEGLTRFDMARGGNRALVLAKALLRRWYLAQADRIIVSSPLELRDSLLADHPRAEVIPHPVFDEAEPRALKRITGPDPEWMPLSVGYIGRFHEKKNVHLLIEALALAPQVRLTIAGAGAPGAEEALKDRARQLGVMDRITWRGFVGAADKAEFYRGVDLVAMPSTFECFGLVGAEALSNGTPVLLSPTVGIAEDVEAAGVGLVVPPRADAIAAAFRKLQEDRDTLERYAGKSLDMALATYSFAAHGARLRACYEALLTPAA